MISRRDLFKWTGAAGTSFLFSHALGGCGGEGDGLPVDPQGRWWLTGNYAPVMDELDVFDLEVEGALPPELDGLFLRNGANPARADSVHWFTGDGMLHGVRLQGGRALWYRNRFVQTLALKSNAPNNVGSNVANTSIKFHAGKLMALYEVGVPHQISVEDLTTSGEYDFGGQLGRPMTAHPKFDPATGEMFFIGYSPFAPFLSYHVVDSAGAMASSTLVDIDHSSMMHDFQLTQNYALLFDFPIHFDSTILESGFPFRWVADAPARIGLIPRDGSSGTPRWIEVDQCFMFHSLNAYEDDDGRIVLEGCRLPEIWAEGTTSKGRPPTPWRWELDLEKDRVSEGQLHDGFGDFPQIDARVAGRKNRINYSLRFPDTDGTTVVRPTGVRKFDRVTEQLQIWDTGPDLQADEPMFVPFGDAEDAGYLLSMVFDRRTSTSFVAVLDAARMQDGPIARVHMPRRVPFGFHGTWLPLG